MSADTWITIVMFLFLHCKTHNAQTVQGGGRGQFRMNLRVVFYINTYHNSSDILAIKNATGNSKFQIPASSSSIMP